MRQLPKTWKSIENSQLLIWSVNLKTTMGNITFYWKASLTLSGPCHLQSLVYLVIAEGRSTNSQRNRSIHWDSKQMKCNHRPLNPDQFSLIPIDWGSTFNQAAARRHICVPLPELWTQHPSNEEFQRNQVDSTSSKSICACLIYTNLNYKTTNSGLFYGNILH